jgi:broad specificity phosphatase PhoE
MRRLTLLVTARTLAAVELRFPRPDEPLMPSAVDDATAWVGRSSRIERLEQLEAGPERRTIETAGLVGGGQGAHVVRELADLDLGSWVGDRLVEIQPRDPDGVQAWLDDPTATPHGGESVAALVDRVGGWLERLGAEQDPGAVRTLAVTHAAVVRAAVLSVLAAAPTAFWSVDAAPLGATTLTHDGRRWALRAHGVGAADR